MEIDQTVPENDDYGFKVPPPDDPYVADLLQVRGVEADIGEVRGVLLLDIRVIVTRSNKSVHRLDLINVLKLI